MKSNVTYNYSMDHMGLFLAGRSKIPNRKLTSSTGLMGSEMVDQWCSKVVSNVSEVKLVVSKASVVRKCGLCTVRRGIR